MELVPDIFAVLDTHEVQQLRGNQPSTNHRLIAQALLREKKPTNIAYTIERKQTSIPLDALIVCHDLDNSEEKSIITKVPFVENYEQIGITTGEAEIAQARFDQYLTFGIDQKQATTYFIAMRDLQRIVQGKNELSGAYDRKTMMKIIADVIRQASFLTDEIKKSNISSYAIIAGGGNEIFSESSNLKKNHLPFLSKQQAKSCITSIVDKASSMYKGLARLAYHDLHSIAHHYRESITPVK